MFIAPKSTSELVTVLRLMRPGSRYRGNPVERRMEVIAGAPAPDLPARSGRI